MPMQVEAEAVATPAPSLAHRALELPDLRLHEDLRLGPHCGPGGLRAIRERGVVGVGDLRKRPQRAMVVARVADYDGDGRSDVVPLGANASSKAATAAFFGANGPQRDHILR